MNEDEEKYLNTLAYLKKICSVREYCRKDILAKATGRLGEEELANRAVDELEKDSFLCETRYARAFARDKACIEGWGPAKIRFALSSKGIRKDDIDAALEETDDEKAYDKLRKSLKNKKRLLEGDAQIKIKLLKFALSRGFEYGKISALVDEVLKDGNDRDE